MHKFRETVRLAQMVDRAKKEPSGVLLDLVLALAEQVRVLRNEVTELNRQALIAKYRQCGCRVPPLPPGE